MNIYAETNPFLIIGGGSNLLLTKDFDGIVLKNEISGKTILEETSNSVLVKIGGGENWHEFVLWAVENNFGGIENMSLIPGSVGASPMQNIGAYGVEIKDVFDHFNKILSGPVGYSTNIDATYKVLLNLLIEKEINKVNK